jgi:hypothetical protein
VLICRAAEQTSGAKTILAKSHYACQGISPYHSKKINAAYFLI